MLKHKILYGPSFRNALTDRKEIRLSSAVHAPAGRTLLFLSDVHLSDRFPAAAVRSLIDQIETLQPDMILLGGDYGESAAWQKQFFELFSRLTPPLGTFGVLGNNDYECFPGDQKPLIRAAADAGVRLLVDETARVATDEGNISIAGLDEYRHARPLSRPLFDEADQSAFRILLSHFPQSSGRYIRREGGLMPHLAMAGHTHGGQFRLLGMTPYSIGYELGIRRYMTAVSGWKQVGGTEFLVSPGLGTSKLPIRINVEPTIHLIRLAR